MFAPIHRAIVSMFVIGFAATTAANASAATAVLLAFSSPHCGPCQAMKPTLEKLAREGAPIRLVDVSRETEFARRHGIRQTPTFVVWSGGRELTRLVGMQSADALREALQTDPSGPFIQTDANVDTRSILNPPQVRSANAAAHAAGRQIEAMPSVSLADAVERAQAATVRLRVHDGHGFGVGTGTVIDRHGDEALVLTCGHLFRETKLESKVEVDLFIGGQTQTVPGHVVDYDADNRDIGLVVIKPGFDLQPVEIADISVAPQSGQSVFSFGCDHGDDPSRRDTRITGVNKYNQHVNASNIEIAGAPVDGRSGGGLFNDRGQLVGVCNAADYKGDIGIYTGPGSIQWQLDRIGLAHLYQGGGQVALASHTAPASQPAPQTRLASLDAPAQAAPLSGSPSIHPPSNGHSAGGQTASLPGGRTGGPVLMIVPDANSPGGKRVITIERPTPELLEMIHRQGR